MRVSLFSMFKPIALSIGTIAVLGLGQGVVRADVVFVTANVNNLASMTLSTAPNTSNGQTFTMQVTFNDPQGISGSNTTTFDAMLSGTVRARDGGGVLLDFINTPILFTFNDMNGGSGSFFFSVNDLAIDPGQTASITGQIMGATQTPSAIPEPTSMLLLGSGLAGVAGAVRRKLRARN